VLIVGDSYTEGTGAGKEEDRWASVAAGLLNLNPRIDGVGGTGFAWGGGKANDQGQQFIVRIRKIADEKIISPDAVVIQGGQNDVLLKNDPAVTRAVVDTVNETKKLWPATQVLIMGPSAPEPNATKFASTSAAVRAGAATAGVPYIDADGENWFDQQNSGTYNFDGNHVNTAGHRLIAEKFAEHWRELTKP